MSFGDHGDCKCAGKTREQVLALFPKTLLAEQALFVASKVSEGVYEVDSLTGEIERGEAGIGAGKTGEKNKATGNPYVPGTDYSKASLCPIVTDNHLLLHDRQLGKTALQREHGVGWRDAFRHYVKCTKLGCIVLAGPPKNFQKWARSEACRTEVAQIDAGRLWAYVKPTHATTADPGHIISVDAIGKTASSSVSTGLGVIAWASGNYCAPRRAIRRNSAQFGATRRKFCLTRRVRPRSSDEGDLKNSKMHGVGAFCWAPAAGAEKGTVYRGEMRNSDFNGYGIKTDGKDGSVQKGLWKDDKFVQKAEFDETPDGYPMVSHNTGPTGVDGKRLFNPDGTRVPP